MLDGPDTQRCLTDCRSGHFPPWRGIAAHAISSVADQRSSAASCAQAAMSTHPTTWRPFAMKLEQSFEVSAPIERVWKALIDVEHVAPCLPGAAVTGRNDDGTYNGTFSIKI